LPSDRSTSTPVSSCANDFTFAMDRHRQLAHPVGEDALDAVLARPEHVVVPGGESR
jgi:hypothetical protein